MLPRCASYKRRNLQAVAAIVAKFAGAHPDLFAGVVLDADTYMNPFLRERGTYDYNPGMLRQFREWLSATGPYAGRARGGAPDLSSYRRRHPLTLGEVSSLAGRHWKSWDDGATAAAPARSRRTPGPGTRRRSGRPW